MMKLNKSYILALGVLGSPLLTISANAQTFYQCMPITCSDGQYIKDGKCTSCSAGTYQKGNNKATSCTACVAGKYSDAGASSCKNCEAGYKCPGGTNRNACPTGTYALAGKSSCTDCDFIDSKNGNKVFGPNSYLYILPIANSFSNDTFFEEGMIGKYKSCDTQTGELKVDLYGDCTRYSDNEEFEKKKSDYQGCTGTCQTIVVSSSNFYAGGCNNFICTGGCQKTITIKRP